MITTVVCRWKWIAIIAAIGYIIEGIEKVSVIQFNNSWKVVGEMK